MADSGNHRYSAPVRIVLGVCSVTILFLTATLGFIFMQAPFAPLLFVNPYLYQCITNFMISSWLTLPPVLNQLFFGTRLRVFGHGLEKYPAGVPEEGWNLFIMNHRTRLDWFYIWLTFLHATNPLRMTSLFKIVLKASLRVLPGFGWAMQISRFLFLERSWEKDKTHITHSLSNLMNHASPHSVLIFPEGTDYEPNSRLSSDRFAAKNGLPPYEYVLHPRVTGTVHFMQELLQGKSLERVVNITVFYPDFIPANEFSLLYGKAPAEIWYFVEVIPFHEIPGVDPNSGELVDKTGESLSNWLKDLWAQKEKMLKQIHQEAKVLHNGVTDSSSLNGHGASGPVTSNSSVNEVNNTHDKVQRFSETKSFGSTILSHKEHKLKSQSNYFNYSVALFWSAFAVFALYLSFTSFWTQMYILFVVASFLGVSWKHGSWDKLEAEVCFNDKRLKVE